MNRPCPLNKGHNISQFDCGIEPLNLYLCRYAGQNQKKEGARTYVALLDNRVVGYYTLVFGSVSWSHAPDELKRGFGKYPIPVLLIARLAVDKSHQGQGLGVDLLQDALERACSASAIAGLRAVVVEAKDENARGFYSRCGFHPFIQDPDRLFVSMTELKKATK